MTANFLSVFAILISLLVAGEAAALGFGTYVMGHGKSWLSVKNDVLLISDVAAGIAILCLAIVNTNVYSSIPFYTLTAILLATHVYREWEYLSDRNNPYCASKPLFIVNNAKLTGLATVLIYSLIKL